MVMLTPCRKHVRVVGRNDGVEEIFVVAIVPGYLGAVDHDVLDLTLVSIVEQLCEVDVLFLTTASCFDDDLPEEEQAGDHEDPDQNLFDGRVQSEFPHFSGLQRPRNRLALVRPASAR